MELEIKVTDSRYIGWTVRDYLNDVAKFTQFRDPLYPPTHKMFCLRLYKDLYYADNEPVDEYVNYAKNIDQFIEQNQDWPMMDCVIKRLRVNHSQNLESKFYTIHLEVSDPDSEDEIVETKMCDSQTCCYAKECPLFVATGSCDKPSTECIRAILVEYMRVRMDLQDLVASDDSKIIAAKAEGKQEVIDAVKKLLLLGSIDD